MENKLQHRYSIPGAEDLTQEEATRRTEDYIKNVLKEEVDLSSLTWTYSFIADDPQAPFWEITLYDGVFIEQNRMYRLLVPARNGEIQVIYDYKTAPKDPVALLDSLAFSNLPQNPEEWTYQQKALYGAWIVYLRDTYPGFDAEKELLVWGLPRDGEISYERAYEFAKERVQELFSGGDHWHETSFPLTNVSFVREWEASNFPAPYWSFVFGEESFFQLMVSGEDDRPVLLHIYSPEDENG